MPTDAALCAAYGTQELLDRILARRVNWRYKIVTDISQAFHVFVSDSGLHNVKKLLDAIAMTKSLRNDFSG